MGKLLLGSIILVAGFACMWFWFWLGHNIGIPAGRWFDVPYLLTTVTQTFAFIIIGAVILFDSF